jgi:methionine salvage enolase-phosphatase E1
MRGVLVNGRFDQLVDQFAKDHVLQYLTDHKEEKTTGMLLQRLREDAQLDQDSGDFGQDHVPQVPGPPAGLDQQIAAAVAYMQWSVTREPDQHPFSPVTLLKDSICKEALAAGQFQTPVYEDAVRLMHGWRYGQHFIKNYTLDAPDAEDQERLMQYTTCGDIRKDIANYIRLGQAEKALLPRTYRTIVAMIRTDPPNILFLTNSRAEAVAANEHNLTIVLVRRPGESVPRDGESSGVTFPTVSSFDQIHFIHDPNRPAACC